MTTTTELNYTLTIQGQYVHPFENDDVRHPLDPQEIFNLLRRVADDIAEALDTPVWVNFTEIDS